jgi:hypothetical protein
MIDVITCKNCIYLEKCNKMLNQKPTDLACLCYNDNTDRVKIIAYNRTRKIK